MILLHDVVCLLLKVLATDMIRMWKAFFLYLLNAVIYLSQVPMG